MAVKVSTADLKSAATKMRSMNNDLDSKLADIAKLMEMSTTEYKSDSGDEVRAQMTALKPKFAEYKSIIESYAAFLETASTIYESGDAGLKQNAGALRQNQ